MSNCKIDDDTKKRMLEKLIFVTYWEATNILNFMISIEMIKNYKFDPGEFQIIFNDDTVASMKIETDNSYISEIGDK